MLNNLVGSALAAVTVILMASFARAEVADVRIIDRAIPNCGQDGDPCGEPFVGLGVVGQNVYFAKYCNTNKDLLSGPNAGLGTVAMDQGGYAGGLSARQYLQLHGTVTLIVTSDIEPGVCIELQDQSGNTILTKILE
jgi:hypothetical protein